MRRRSDREPVVALIQLRLRTRLAIVVPAILVLWAGVWWAIG